MLDRRKFLLAGFGFGLTCVSTVGQFRPDADLTIALQTDFSGRMDVGRLATMIGNELTDREVTFLKAYLYETMSLTRGPAITLFIEHDRPYPLVYRAMRIARGKVDLLELDETGPPGDEEVEWPWTDEDLEKALVEDEEFKSSLAIHAQTLRVQNRTSDLKKL